MPELPPTRRSLLVQLRNRSNTAWLEFLQVYEQAIYRYCRSRGLQDADARDVTQDVLAAVDQRFAVADRVQWNDDPEAGSFRGWLFRVARNIALHRIDERSRRNVASGDTQMAERLAELPEREAADSALWLEYRRALLRWAAEAVRPQVADNSWQAFWHTAIEGCKPEEVARELSMSVGGVYTAKCRVFARIKKEIAGLDSALIEGLEMPAQRR